MTATAEPVAKTMPKVSKMCLANSIERGVSISSPFLTILCGLRAILMRRANAPKNCVLSRSIHIARTKQKSHPKVALLLLKLPISWKQRELLQKRQPRREQRELQKLREQEQQEQVLAQQQRELVRAWELLLSFRKQPRQAR
jgi:hypothetical protein